MDQICRTCKYWTAPTEEWQEGKGTCAAIDDAYYVDTKVVIAYIAACGGNCHGSLQTNPEFFCALWTKPTTEIEGQVICARD